MLKVIDRAEDVLEFCWHLSQSNNHASCPRVKSLDKLKRSLEKAIDADCEGVIACYREGELCGVCVYHWDTELLFELHGEFGSQQEVIYFVEESSEDELSLVLAAGFEIHERTRCYSLILR